jgi:formiminotetrahydrofolate cyclodeaminase
MSASLISMVAGLSMGKEKYRDVQAVMTDAAGEALSLRERALALYTEDIAAFNGVMEAFRLAKGSQEEKAARAMAIDSALEQAALVPMELARLSVRLLELSALAARRGNPNAASDAGVAALTAHAALGGAALNVRINAASVKGETKERLESLLTELAALEERGNGIRDDALAACAANIG